MSFRPCAIVPSRNHYKALPQVVAGLRELGLTVFIMDDGSDQPAAAAIAALHAPEHGVSVHRRDINQGKGVAVTDGFQLAHDAGYSHAIQVDADGQHDLTALPAMLEQAATHPQALVSGAPVYDESIPTGRKIGRWVTHLWVFVETLSLRITDSMCGFRIYPLAPCMALLAEARVGARMDFDTDIMVRLFWRGVPPIMVPVRVTYPPDNISNFDVLRDNVRITRMHTRLVFTMLRRLPAVLTNRPPRLTATPSHWAMLAERGAGWGLSFTATIYRLLGRRACMAMLVPVVLYFALTGHEQTRASRDFLGRVQGRQPTRMDVFRHLLDFAGRALDTLAAWTGALGPQAVTPADPEELSRAAADPRGALLVVSHHGNAELSRALMAPELRERLTVLVHTRHAENFNRVLRDFRPDMAARMVQVTEIGPETAITLKERVERGEWVAIAGDRVPVLSHNRVVSVPFLGAPALFSQGPWLLAALLDCPVRLLFCWRDRPGHWRMALEPFAEQVDLPRGRRTEAMTALAAAYAARLEAHARSQPRQWYNFFDFWAPEEKR